MPFRIWHFGTIVFDLSDLVFNTIFLESNSRLSLLDDLEEIDDIQV